MDMLEAMGASLDQMVQQVQETSTKAEGMNPLACADPTLLHESILGMLRGQVMLMQQLSMLCSLVDLVRKGIPIPPAPPNPYR